MSKTVLEFTDDELRQLRYMILGTNHVEALTANWDPKIKEAFGILKQSVILNPKDLNGLTEALEHLSYLDYNKRFHWQGAKFLQAFPEENRELFVEAIKFMFLPAKQRPGYSFSGDIRERMADLAIKSDIYIPEVINHYFTLLAKSGSWAQRSRINSWLKMPKVKKDKSLILILAKSRHRGVQIAAIDHADKGLYGFMIGDISDEIAQWYLEKKMSNFKFTNYKPGKRSDWELRKLYEQDTGKSTRYSRR